MANKKVTGWFTMNGKHIPMFEGESKDDAVKRAVKQDKPSKNSVVVVKKKEIDATNKNDADKLSKRDSDKKSVAEKNEDIKAKQIAQAKADADKASGKVTRKDVEDLTAKKDALKGAKLNAKPISKEEVDAQKKTWGSDNASGKKSAELDKETLDSKYGLSKRFELSDDVKKQIDNYDESKLSKVYEDNNKMLERLNKKIASSTSSTDTAYLASLQHKHQMIKSYIDGKQRDALNKVNNKSKSADGQTKDYKSLNTLSSSQLNSLYDEALKSKNKDLVKQVLMEMAKRPSDDSADTKRTITYTDKDIRRRGSRGRK